MTKQTLVMLDEMLDKTEHMHILNIDWCTLHTEKLLSENINITLDSFDILLNYVTTENPNFAVIQILTTIIWITHFHKDARYGHFY